MAEPVIITVIVLVVLLILALAGFGYWYFNKRETDPDALAVRRDIKEKTSTLKAAKSRRDREISMVNKEVRRAEKTRQNAIKSAEQLISHLADYKGKSLGSYQGVQLHELWISTPHGKGSLVGVTASVDSQVSSRITATRLVAIGVFALAAKKKTGAQYLSIDGPEFASVVTCPQDEHQKSREFAVKINNAAKSAARLVAERPARLQAAREALVAAQDSSQVDHQKARLAAVEANPSLLGAIAAAETALDTARLGGPPAQVEPTITRVSFDKKPL